MARPGPAPLPGPCGHALVREALQQQPVEALAAIARAAVRDGAADGDRPNAPRSFAADLAERYMLSTLEMADRLAEKEAEVQRRREEYEALAAELESLRAVNAAEERRLAEEILALDAQPPPPPAEVGDAPAPLPPSPTAALRRRPQRGPEGEQCSSPRNRDVAAAGVLRPRRPRLLSQVEANGQVGEGTHPAPAPPAPPRWAVGLSPDPRLAENTSHSQRSSAQPPLSDASLRSVRSTQSESPLTMADLQTSSIFAEADVLGGSGRTGSPALAHVRDLLSTKQRAAASQPSRRPSGPQPGPSPVKLSRRPPLRYRPPDYTSPSPHQPSPTAAARTRPGSAGPKRKAPLPRSQSSRSSAVSPATVGVPDPLSAVFSAAEQQYHRTLGLHSTLPGPAHPFAPLLSAPGKGHR